MTIRMTAPRRWLVLCTILWGQFLTGQVDASTPAGDILSSSNRILLKSSYDSNETTATTMIKVDIGSFSVATGSLQAAPLGPSTILEHNNTDRSSDSDHSTSKSDCSVRIILWIIGSTLGLLSVGDGVYRLVVQVWWPPEEEREIKISSEQRYEQWIHYFISQHVQAVRQYSICVSFCVLLCRSSWSLVEKGCHTMSPYFFLPIFHF
jgi:hypothetical protein